MAAFHRIYLGTVSADGMDRILEAIRAEHRSDDLSWYAVEITTVPPTDHPRNPGHKWTEIEGDE